jgi:hypothetical protein
MNMKFKLMLSAVLVAGVISASAADETAAASSAANTSAKGQFGDPVIATGKGFVVKKSELDFLLKGAKAQAAAHSRTLPPDYTVILLNQLIDIQLLNQKATDADRAKGRTAADAQYANMVKRAGSAEAVDSKIKASGLSLDEFHARLVQETTSQAVLLRELNIKETDPKAIAQKIVELGPEYFENLRKELNVQIVDPKLQAMVKKSKAGGEENAASGQANATKDSDQAQDEVYSSGSPTAEPPSSAVHTEMSGIMQRLNAKLENAQGHVTAEDIADDLKAIDALIAKHPEKTEEMAEIVFAKMMIYLRELKDPKQGQAIMNQLKTDYKGTKLVNEIAKAEAAQAAAKKTQDTPDQ